ncbi:MAG: GC-type dockerin domain-anchored protein [Phycisphaerales bacterium]
MNTNSLWLIAGCCIYGLSSAAPVQTSCEPQYLTPDASASSFGRAVAMTDRHLLIGDWHDSRYCTIDPTCSNGMVYAYEKDADGRWVLAQRVEPADLGPRFAYGAAVAVHEDWMVATAAGDGTGMGGHGAAYFFQHDGEQWVERQQVFNPSRFDFGYSAVLHGDIAVIQGGVGPTGGNGAIVYHFDSERWNQIEILESIDAVGEDAGFGYTLAIDDQRVVIGAQLESSTVTNGGAAYVFRRQPDGTLAFEQKLIAPDVLEGPRLGTAVTIEGDTLVLGGMLSDRPETAQGAAYAYRLIEGRWELVQEFTAEGSNERDRFGRAMALDGDRLVVTSMQGDTAAGPTGSAYVFARGAGGLWAQVAELPPSTPEWVLEYGGAVAMRGNDVVVGASYTMIDGDKRGAAHAFDLSCEICPPDLDLDGSLTIYDFLTYLNLFQDGNPQADFDGDGELTIFDFLAFQDAFQAGCG